MKKLLLCLFFICCLSFSFLLGAIFMSIDEINVNRNFNDNVEELYEKDYEEFVEESTLLQDDSSLVGEFTTLMEDVKDNLVVDQKKIIAKSVGTFSSMEGDVEYIILRVHLTYNNNIDVSTDKYVYLYYQIIDYKTSSLFKVADEITVKII